MNQTKKSSGPSDLTDQSSTANANGTGSNNDGNRNLSGREIEEVAQATSDGAPFIFVDSMPSTFCPPTVPDLAQKEAERMAVVVAECDQLLERLEDTKPPPHMEWPSTMIEEDEDFLRELQELCIFSDEIEAEDVEELCNFPGITRQATFYIDRSNPILDVHGYGGGSLICYTDTMTIVNQIGDQLMELQKLKGKPLVERAISCFLVTIKPEAGASNCFVAQIGVPASFMPPEVDSIVPEKPEKEPIVQLEQEPIVQLEQDSVGQLTKKSVVQLEKEPILELVKKSSLQTEEKTVVQPVKKSVVQPKEKTVVKQVKKSQPVGVKIVNPRAEKASHSTNAVQKSRFSSHAKMPVSKAVGPKPGPTINEAAEKNAGTIVTPRISSPRWKQINQSKFGYLSKRY